MTAALYVTLANSMLQQLDGNYEWIQLHTGSPGSAGTSNVAAESDRFQVEWDVAAGGSIQIADPVTIMDVAASETWTHFTAWSASMAGTVGVRGTVSVGAVVAGADITIAVDALTVTFTLAS